jgi:carboxypeptidase C (cathepsin A)
MDNECVYYFNDFKPHKGPASCDLVWNQTNTLAENLNWYDLYRTDGTPLTQTLTEENRYKTVMIDGQEKTYKSGRTVSEYTPWLSKFIKNPKVTNDLLSDYMNSQELRDALHIPSYLGGFDQCWNDTKFTYVIADKASKWIYPEMKTAGIKIVFYSGDTDGAVPTYGTKRWIKDLNWNITTEWAPWTDQQGQIAGYIEQYDGMDFATIKGVGHMAPQWAKPAMNKFFTNWIHGIKIE